MTTLLVPPAPTPDTDALFVLGAADPEMNAIQLVLETAGLPCVFAHAGATDRRVHPGNAYMAALPAAACATLRRGGRVWLVECCRDAPSGCTRIDHHHPGDPGYGLPPAAYWRASSLGQTLRVLADAFAITVPETPELHLVAAADHCLGAAYAGACPSIDPAALLAWHVASRAAFERRSVARVERDIARTRAALRAAPMLELAPGILARDLRAVKSGSELVIAAACEAQCVISVTRNRDGRDKVGCLIGDAAQVRAFIQRWAPAHGLIDIYGDPVRGFAGAYRPAPD